VRANVRAVDRQPKSRAAAIRIRLKYLIAIALAMCSRGTRRRLAIGQAAGVIQATQRY
jgi:hypothetical protein